MNKFDTHGGHYEPQGYMRVNAGGSHEENPNGGVQVGVDPEGTPNLLEEGEPVYNDYVYSDNITADADILKKHNIHFKYGGKLYSEIADTFVDEAAETPLDPIANNGLNAMLVRLADAQEEQKTVQQQKELEEELAAMSPEELDELEQMLAQQEAQPQEVVPAQEPVMEGVTSEPVPQEMPMMAEGGPIGRLDPFLKRKFPDDPSTMQYLTYRFAQEEGLVPGLPEVYPYDFKSRVQAQRAINEYKSAVKRREDQKKWENSKVYRWLDNLDNKYLRDTWLHPYYDSPLFNYDTGERKQPIIRPVLAEGGNLFRQGNPLERRTHYRSVQWPYENAYNQFDVPIYDGTDEPITPILEEGNIVTSNYSGPTLLDALHAKQSNPLARFTYTPKTYSVSGPSLLAQTGIAGSPRKNKARYPMYEMTPEELDAIDRRATAELNNLQAGLLPSIHTPYAPGLGRKDANGNTIMYGRPADIPVYAEAKPESIREEVVVPRLRDVAARPATPATTSAASDNGMLPVWPRYAGAVTSGLLGLYNAFQEPDKYDIPSYTPVLPEGRMHFIDPIYNPLDQNQAVNDVLNASAGTTRAINNSGLGAAAQVTLLAQDYNTGRSLGTALATAREANNQRLNDVIARRNQNAATLGNFNYGQSRDRAQILNDAAIRNLQNDILEKRLNYAAEGQKYAAVQNQIDSVAQALSNIGRENAAMNMVNGDEAYAYALNRLFDPYYKGRIAACGGKIKKTKK
jgi:hypothetical protein